MRALETHPRILGGAEALAGVQELLRDFGFALFDLDFQPVADLSGRLASGRGGLPPAFHLVCLKDPTGIA